MHTEETTTTDETNPASGFGAFAAERTAADYRTVLADQPAARRSEEPAAERRTKSPAPERPTEELRVMRSHSRDSANDGQVEVQFTIEGYLTVATPSTEATQYPIAESVEQAVSESPEFEELRRLHETNRGYQRRAVELRGELDQLEAKLISVIRASDDPTEIEKRIAAIPAEIASLERRSEVLKEPLTTAALKATAFARHTHSQIRIHALEETEDAYRKIFAELCSDGELTALNFAYQRWNSLLNSHDRASQLVEGVARAMPTVPAAGKPVAADDPIGAIGTIMLPKESLEVRARRERRDHDAQTEQTRKRLAQDLAAE